MTNAVSSIIPCSLNNHIEKKHDSSFTGEKETFCIYPTLSVTNAASCIASYSSNNHIKKTHDSSHIGEEETSSTCSSLGTGQFSDILQCDGADTVSESSLNDNTDNVQGVTNVQNPTTQTMPPASISTNTRVNVSAELPVVAVANARSLLPKLKSTIEKFQNEELSIFLLVEVWEKSGKKNAHFQAKMEEMLQLEGLKYISC